MGIAHRSITAEYSAKTRKQDWARPVQDGVKSLGDWLQMHLQAANLAPCYLAERIGVSTRLVREWALGTAVPTPQQLATLTKFFGCSLNLELFSRVSLPSQ